MPKRTDTPDNVSEERLTNELNIRLSELENLYEKKFQAVNGKLIELRQQGLDALVSGTVLVLFDCFEIVYLGKLATN
jgi:hypothetical protein